ncbi:hypothetical protein CLOM_g9280 [Closterium sp. NIES-68]|nr:hypothetical protein CLOM_g9280 [Closterium sp. NIES-68]
MAAATSFLGGATVAASSLSASASLSSTASLSQSAATVSVAAPRCASLAVRCDQRAPETADVSRRGFSMAAVALLMAPAMAAFPARALLEADDDDDLLERMKRERKEKIELRESRGTYKTEEADIQAAVYGLSKVGAALEAGNSSAAAAELTAGWVGKADAAIAKISRSDAEKSLAAAFQSAIAALQSAAGASDVKGAKKAFLAAASALESWAKTAALDGELLGL